MNKEDVEKIVLTEISRMLVDCPEDAEKVCLESTFFNDLGFDSLDVIDLDEKVEQRLSEKLGRHQSSAFDEIFSANKNPRVQDVIDDIWQKVQKA